MLSSAWARHGRCGCQHANDDRGPLAWWSCMPEAKSAPTLPLQVYNCSKLTLILVGPQVCCVTWWRHPPWGEGVAGRT